MDWFSVSSLHDMQLHVFYNALHVHLQCIIKLPSISACIASQLGQRLNGVTFLQISQLNHRQLGVHPLRKFSYPI